MAEKEEIACRMSMMHNVMLTAAQMARDRNYVVGGTGETLPANVEQFRERYSNESGQINRQHMTIPCEHRKTLQKMQIIFNGDPKLTAKELIDIRRKAAVEGASRILLILAAKPNPMCAKEIDKYSREEHGVKVQAFLEEDLVFNITTHELVPEHIPLEPEEAEKVLQAHSLSVEMLPRMLTTDPVSQYFGLERGRVVKIKRKSESALEYVTYRQVV
jgi:DNA-directed RNA polymerase I, II, and III subunit RPABC1